MLLAFIVCNDVIKNFKLTIFLTKVLHNVNKPILNDLCKFQVDTTINAKVTAVQSFKNLHTFMLRQPCWWARENSPTSFACNSVFVGPNGFKCGTETCCMVL